MSAQPSIDELHFENAPSVGTIPGKGSKKLLARQKRIDSNAVAYPHDLPIAFEDGRGATLRDVDGNTYLDFFAGIGVFNVGHANPYVLEGVQEQISKITHTLDLPTVSRLDLIEKLNEIAPVGLSREMKVLFGGPTGSDAIEGSIKLAKYNTGKRGLIAFRGSYHGSTAGAGSLTAGKQFKEDYGPMLPDVYHARYPYPFNQDISSEAAVREALRDVREIIDNPYGGLANPAGIWVEPIQGEGGIIVPPDGFLPGLRQIANDNGIPLIVDEIQTGLGRTGKMFCCEHSGVTPDAIVLGKALGGIGLPLSAMIYVDDLDTWGPGAHVGTFRGNAPAMVGGFRAIEYIQEQRLLSHAEKIGHYICKRLQETADHNPIIGEVRGKGLMIGAEFISDDGKPNNEAVKGIREYCYKRGVLVWKGGYDGHVLRMLPPLVITEEQVEYGMDIIVEAINHV